MQGAKAAPRPHALPTIKNKEGAMTTETLKLYKLIVLYFLSLAKQDITNAILSDFILQHGYTNYFSIQETLAALTEDDMIQTNHTHTTTYYTITDRGWEALNYFSSHLPYDTRLEIKQYLQDRKIQIAADTSVRTDYTKVSSSEYLVTGTVLERGSILYEISVSVPTEKKAIEMCRSFKKNSDTIYGFLLKTLSK